MKERLIDEAKIYVKGGDGGSGCTSFRREKCIPRGGPDGGSGGQGGTVYLEADSSMSDLLAFKYKVHFKAKRGDHGKGSLKDGKYGEDMVVKVPTGTIVYDVESGDALADLVAHGERFPAARGGRGGKGNTEFKTAMRHIPRFAEKGEPGEEHWLKLELKLLADVAIIGFPNAGKSTLLSMLTRALPKVAPYPFTTLTPMLGVAAMQGKVIVIADVPGLIEGAHRGQGLGIEFLRHIERTKMLLHLIDAAECAGEDDPFLPYEKLREELRQYREALMTRPELIVFNKVDLLEGEAPRKLIRESFRSRGREVKFLSCETGEGLEALREEVFSKAWEAPVPEKVVHIVERPAQPEFTVRQDEGRYVVEGKRVEHMVAMIDLDNDEAVQHLQKKLKRLGVEEALLARGAKEGDTVAIGKSEFDFSPDG
ncbi:MAG: GTPase ObgE [Candidatus Eremiobacteraeota bacterium]|nr:GTPase ObgE [Candidatus Eremiobacteraeota bacterium]